MLNKNQTEPNQEPLMSMLHIWSGHYPNAVTCKIKLFQKG